MSNVVYFGIAFPTAAFKPTVWIELEQKYRSLPSLFFSSCDRWI